VMLSKLELEIRDPLRVHRVVCEGHRAERVPDPQDDLLRSAGDRRPNALCEQSTIRADSIPGVDHNRDFVQCPSRALQKLIHGPEMRQHERTALRTALIACAPAKSDRPRPTAPPYQQAATPMPPQQYPERSTSQPASPTRCAGTASKRTGPLGISARPRACH
jgi:hypothetical protein